MDIYAVRGSARASRAAVEALEGRQFLSASAVAPADAADSPVAAIAVTASAGKKFHDAVGTWTTTDGLPKKGSGVTASATIDWGDGSRASRAKLSDDGSGVVRIVGAHAWKQAGTFQVHVEVVETTKGRPPQVTQVGEADGSATVAAKAQGKLSLKGTVNGSYTTPLGNPDARSYQFTGSGTAGTLGQVGLDGSITPPGFIKSAPVTGQLTLTGATGTVTLDVTGKPQAGGSALPQKLKYAVSGGTGAYSAAAGKGTIAVALDPSTNTFVAVLR